jgi:hypothetical protein
MFVHCQRSPGGSWLAVSSTREEIISGKPAPLLLINLSQVDSPLFSAASAEKMYTSQFAFSPDQHYLAALGYLGDAQVPGLYLVDLASHQVRLLRSNISGGFLTWTPDLSYLALIGAESSGGGLDLLLIDAASGQVVTTRTMRFIADMPIFEPAAPNWPTQLAERGIQALRAIGDVDSCLLAP